MMDRGDSLRSEDASGRVAANVVRRGGWAQAWPAVALGLLLLASWEAIVRIRDIPPYMLPAPGAIAAKFWEQRTALGAAWLVTLETMAAALAAAVVVGVALAALLASSRRLENCLFPYAVILQVTPLVAVAPFVVLWIGYERVWLTQIVCAWIVAFFPILSGTAIGLRSTDRGLVDLFDLYGATTWQKLWLLRAKAALPYFLSGLKVSANLSLVGAVVAEFVTGAIEAEGPGLASTIFTAQSRSDAPLMFAALALVSLTGVVVFFATHLLSWLLLRNWHESATGES